MNDTFRIFVNLQKINSCSYNWDRGRGNKWLIKGNVWEPEFAYVYWEINTDEEVIGLNLKDLVWVINTGCIGHRQQERNCILSGKIKQRSLLTFIDSDVKEEQNEKFWWHSIQTISKAASCFIRIMMTGKKDLEHLGKVCAGGCACVSVGMKLWFINLVTIKI